MEMPSDLTCILGLGTRSTAFYVEQLHTRYHQLLGDYHTFPFVMYQVDFNRFNPYLPDQFEVLVPELTQCLESIAQLPSSQYLFPNITLHETLDRIDHKLHIIHPLELTIAHCKKRNIKDVVIFGSHYTMTSSYFTNTLKTSGISVSHTTEKEMLQIDTIRKKLYNDTNTGEDFVTYQKLIDSHCKTAHVLTACTELSLYHSKLKNTNVIDMAMLQIEAAINSKKQSL